MIKYISLLFGFVNLLYFHLSNPSLHIYTIQDDTLLIKKKIIFYNVENLFHPSDDPVKNSFLITVFVTLVSILLIDSPSTLSQ